MSDLSTFSLPVDADSHSQFRQLILPMRRIIEAEAPSGGKLFNLGLCRKCLFGTRLPASEYI
ncbi:hypothetical protein KOR42_00310 [Thalassoglobus neptunius]|uniref:Uncharacterized protein n=1 Tax=Thalassoglobus neptunius TaxID=1938619 RepID=A0A5C5X1C8_9PLAN|nr:hypothetical protein KOR42_00310 [Thalassoglobus neptunius]